MATLKPVVCLRHFWIEFSYDGDHRQHAIRNGEGGYDDRFVAATAAAGGTVGMSFLRRLSIVYGFLLNLSILSSLLLALCRCFDGRRYAASLFIIAKAGAI